MLDEKGSNLASILREMVKRKAAYLGEINGALGQVVPGLSSLQVEQVGGSLVVKLRHDTVDGGGRFFDLSQESMEPCAFWDCSQPSTKSVLQR